MTLLHIFTLTVFALMNLIFITAGAIWFRADTSLPTNKPTGKSLAILIISILNILAQFLALWVGDVDGLRAWFGLGMVGLSCATFFWALRTNRARRLTRITAADTPEHLVTGGPYRYVRHPFYSAYIIVIGAAWLASAEHWFSGIFMLSLVYYIANCRLEERKFLSSPLAESYERYRQCTGQLAPNPLKLWHSLHQ